MKEEDYKIWEENVFNAIKDVSDIEMQRILWLGKDPNRISSFSEVYSVLYDDFDFRDYIEYYGSKHSEDNFLKEMKILDEMLSNYHPQYPERDAPILIDPKWREITEQAERTYDCRSKV